MRTKLSPSLIGSSLNSKALLKALILIGFLIGSQAFAQTSNANRTFSGTVVNQQFELVPNVSIEVETSDGKLTTVTDGEGNFSLKVPSESLSVKFFGKNINAVTRIFAVTDTLVGLQVKISLTAAAVNESVTIQADSVTPEIDRRNDTVYKNTLFGRDDQIVQGLNAGINAGQHEGGGKSLEIRRASPRRHR